MSGCGTVPISLVREEGISASTVLQCTSYWYEYTRPSSTPRAQEIEVVIYTRWTLQKNQPGTRLAIRCHGRKPCFVEASEGYS